MTEQEWENFFGAARRWWGTDLTSYKRTHLDRRLTTFMVQEGLTDVPALMARGQNDPEFWERVHSYLTIHVSEFFRDAPYWQAWTQAILQRPDVPLKFWSAGASWGAEPVTLAVLMNAAGRSCEILATDSDVAILREAKTMEYGQEVMSQIPMQYRQYFERIGPDRWRLISSIGRHIRFMRHHLLSDPYPSGFHGILCRNVLIYFEPSARWTVAQKLAQALLPQGYLWLGATETLLEWRGLGLRVVGPSLFQKIANPIAER